MGGGPILHSVFLTHGINTFWANLPPLTTINNHITPLSAKKNFVKNISIINLSPFIVLVCLKHFFQKLQDFKTVFFSSILLLNFAAFIKSKMIILTLSFMVRL